MAPSVAFIVMTESKVADCGAVLAAFKQVKKPRDEVIILTRSDRVSEVALVDQSWCRVVGIPDASVFTLRAHIPTLSQNDWLVVLEEHSPATVATLEAIRNTIESQRNTDLFVFLGRNLTSVGPWGWANFLHTFALAWAPIKGPPPFSPVTAAVVRRAALGTDDALKEGEWEERTIPGIFASGRIAYSNDIYIDHVRHLNVIPCMLVNYHNARACAGLSRGLGRSKKSIVREGWHIFVKRPWRLARARAERWGELPRGTLWRMHVVAFAFFIGYTAGAFFGPGQSAHKID
jgi:hypothetical protein